MRTSFPTVRIFRTAIGLMVSAVSLLQALSCPDAKDLQFIQGLNREGRYSLVVFQAELYRSVPEPCPPFPEIDLELGKALYQLGDFPRVREILRPLVRDSGGGVQSRDSRYRKYFLESFLLDFSRPLALDSGLAMLEVKTSFPFQPEEERQMFLAGAYFMKGRASEARKVWPGNDKGGTGCDGGGKPPCYLEAGFKKPWAAAAMSVVPGLGYVYAGQPGDGVFGFALVSLFYGVAAYYSLYDSPGRAWTLAGFGAVFHVSSMYGAQRAVKEANRRRKTTFLISLHKLLFP